MNRLQALAGWLVCLASVGGLLTQDGRWFALALPLALWLLLGRHFAPRPVQLSIERRFDPASPVPGQVLRVTVSLVNLGERLELVKLADELPAFVTLAGGSTVWRGSLATAQVVEFCYSILFKRGVHWFGNPTVSQRVPFWLGSRVEAILGRQLLFAPLSPVAAPVVLGDSSALRPFPGVSGVRRAGEGAEFYGTRDYYPGDPLRSLNWRAGALWGQSIVNIFEGERAIDVGVILDCRAEAYESGDQFESACVGALSLSRAFLDGGNRVAFMRYGADLKWLAPGAGKVQGYKISQSCAEAALGDHLAFEYLNNLPIQLFPPRSLVLMVSPLLPDDVRSLRSMKALGYEVVVLKPELARDIQPGDAESLAFAKTLLRLENQVLVRKLTTAGVVIMPWAIGQNLAQVRPLGGRRRHG
ncbi:MAG: hypothetical protein A2087_07395 [Spirochaetes bacterium GWD1_61_31]|nr:MAG: hypothetical protein A2Y37_08080 [Spirochaetes bacterium GWB1_60_80]OHD34236.1 MAG: hypothetical protein A2004_12665 [Spirochaetes bacterium GWC1_61_12]OHD40164.1 MAG: hypothetical protein A2087_07395 [Spirochaetes bacterium GWD1_61_31]OHD45788.1 MAG: hypothetical protein A2Y35_03715 [Spirochaetes bacterium GWE1_60_18]OHD58331.1 MAG: hypothetical protein A2Y32_06105 [Spirochaetes bacterium GWF1_60_12]HAW86328.1 hypothetical protein [Spirochaetaceae bacterium]